MEEWEEISRDPHVLTDFLLKIGIQGCEVEEIYSLETLEDSKQVHGIILLYTWNPKCLKESVFADPDLCVMSLLDPRLSTIQALLTILLNSDVCLGQELLEFRNFILPLTSKLKAVALHNSAFLRSANNSLPSLSSKDHYFFTSFLPRKGKVIEIDCLGNGPLYHGESNEEDWLERAKHSILEKISVFKEHDAKFSLLAVTNNRLEVSKNALKLTDQHISTIKKKMGMKVADFDAEYLENLPEDTQTLNAELMSKEEVKAHHESIVKSENSGKFNWKKEGERRKHNYVPFILALLRKLEENNKLGLLLDQALKKKANNS